MRRIGMENHADEQEAPDPVRPEELGIHSAEVPLEVLIAPPKVEALCWSIEPRHVLRINVAFRHR